MRCLQPRDITLNTSDAFTDMHATSREYAAAYIHAQHTHTLRHIAFHKEITTERTLLISHAKMNMQKKQ